MRFIWTVCITTFATLLVVKQLDSAVHNSNRLTRRANDPPATWKEHWFEHNQNLNLHFSDASVAIYYDSDVSSSITWPNTYLSKLWSFVKQKYGSFGPDPLLYAVFHVKKYSGGHPSVYFDESHDYRNVIDCGSNDPNAWSTGNDNDISIPTHEVAHIVELAANNVKGSPAFGIWHDSKWAEIFNYDVYLNLGRTTAAQTWFDDKTKTTDNFPRADTYWFRDWFYPIYSQQGNQGSIARYFTLLSQYFPKRSATNGQGTYNAYSRVMNFGEFVHFWSGATGMDLKTLALTAFGNKDEQGNDWTLQLDQARVTFPSVAYFKDITSTGTLSVSTENGSGSSAVEGSLKLVDGDYRTKFFANTYTSGMWIQITFPTPQIIRSYTITSGNDAPNRDPKSWQLLAFNDGTPHFQIDVRNNENFQGRLQTKRFDLGNQASFKYVRLQINENIGSPNLQISEFRLMQ